eukprot:CAMPEP_0185737818 /NCGR_PEP_ID=MMETSP1171-20130828/31359_1 /TAXON_ID=374046 /ORGANISM="Helicotheca tamensis, Strain CCMP826" /LENGTH=251 /DNA_ID=CAMNT_0028408827 /DNA_START=125 /DNA_END=880 /DNA_ORIENTATION=-
MAAATPVTLPPHTSQSNVPPESCLAVVMDDVLSKEECGAVIAMAEKVGFSYPITASFQMENSEGEMQTFHVQNPRLHKRATIDDSEFAQVIWNRLSGPLSEHMSRFAKRVKCGPPISINPRLRVLKYTGNDSFQPHFDGFTRLNDTAASLCSVLIYLNSGGGDDFCGGETKFLDIEEPSKDMAIIVPKQGRVVVFEHTLFHTGSPLEKMESKRLAEEECHRKSSCGKPCKLALRTDLFFEGANPLYEAEKG